MNLSGNSVSTFGVWTFFQLPTYLKVQGRRKNNTPADLVRGLFEFGFQFNVPDRS